MLIESNNTCMNSVVLFVSTSVAIVDIFVKSHLSEKASAAIL